MRTLAGSEASVHFTHLSASSSSTLASLFAGGADSSRAKAYAHQQSVLDLMKKKGVPLKEKSSEYGRYQAPEWKNKLSYAAGSDEFNAILATPNGAIGTFFLLQHRKQFGVQIWSIVSLQQAVQAA